ncbi:MAG: LuxR C-terminal-related transcriptional regulator [Bacteroidota bacterium]
MEKPAYTPESVEATLKFLKEKYREVSTESNSFAASADFINALIQLSSIRTLPVYFYILDIPAMRYSYIDERIKYVLGWDPDNLIKGGLSFTISNMHTEDLEYVQSVESECVAIYKSLPLEDKQYLSLDYSYRVRASDGNYFWLRQQSTPLLIDAEGNLLLTFALCTDITAICGGRRRPYTIKLILPDGTNRVLNTGRQGPRPVISRKEMEVLRFLATGMTSKDIAGRLHISSNTVNNHRKNILRKTGCANIAEAIRFAMTQGYLEQED